MTLNALIKGFFGKFLLIVLIFVLSLFFYMFSPESNTISSGSNTISSESNTILSEEYTENKVLTEKQSFLLGVINHTNNNIEFCYKYDKCLNIDSYNSLDIDISREDKSSYIEIREISKPKTFSKNFSLDEFRFLLYDIDISEKSLELAIDILINKVDYLLFSYDFIEPTEFSDAYLDIQSVFDTLILANIKYYYEKEDKNDLYLKNLGKIRETYRKFKEFYDEKNQKTNNDFSVVKPE